MLWSSQINQKKLPIFFQESPLYTVVHTKSENLMIWRMREQDVLDFSELSLPSHSPNSASTCSILFWLDIFNMYSF